MALFNVFLFFAFAISAGLPAEAPQCGHRKLNHHSLILGGKSSSPGRWPWHVTISHLKENVTEAVCGGTIIDSYTILTAAHCLYTEQGVISINRVIVHVGRTRISVNNWYTKFHAPYEFMIHPNYTQYDQPNDIAMIKLASEIEMSDYVQPVCICPDDEKIIKIVGGLGTVVGFGLKDNYKVSDHLREAKVPVVDLWDCLESNRDLFGKVLTRNMLCAGYRNGTGPCDGDSGGGLVFQSFRRWCVRGIVSFTEIDPDTNNCDRNQYVVYTDVAKYKEWIRNNSNALQMFTFHVSFSAYSDTLYIIDKTGNRYEIGDTGGIIGFPGPEVYTSSCPSGND